jgi:hypothetical protein
MFLSAVTGNAELIVASMAAVSVFSAFIATFRPSCRRYRQIWRSRSSRRSKQRLLYRKQGFMH